MLTVSALHRSYVQSLHSTDHMWTASCTPITCRQRPALDISHVDSVCPPKIVCTQSTLYISHVDSVLHPTYHMKTVSCTLHITCRHCLPSTVREYTFFTLQITCGQHLHSTVRSCKQSRWQHRHSRGIEMGTSHSRQGRAAIVPLSLHTTN